MPRHGLPVAIKQPTRISERDLEPRRFRVESHGTNPNLPQSKPKIERQQMKLKTHITAASIALALIIGAPNIDARDDKKGPGKDPMTESLRPLKSKEFEVMFLKHMIHHHQMAVETGGLTQSNTKRAELNKLGAEIVSKQKSEIDQMTGWLKSWHNETPGSMEGMPGMETMMKEMEALKTAKDAGFDRMFLDHMIHHHQGAVEMAKLIDGRSDRGELKQLGQNVIKDQKKEIAQMKEWQKAWFKK